MIRHIIFIWQIMQCIPVTYIRWIYIIVSRSVRRWRNWRISWFGRSIQFGWFLWSSIFCADVKYIFQRPPMFWRSIANRMMGSVMRRRMMNNGLVWLMVLWL